MHVYHLKVCHDFDTVEFYHVEVHLKEKIPNFFSGLDLSLGEKLAVSTSH